MSNGTQVNTLDPRLARKPREPGEAAVTRGERLRRAAPPPKAEEPAMAPPPARAAPEPVPAIPAPALPPAVGATAQLPVRRGEVSRGLRYLHDRANANTSEILWLTASLQAALEALHAGGHVDPDALERRRAELSGELAGVYSERGMGVSVDAGERDKYAMTDGVEIDCGSRLHLCKAACCKLRFSLSRQDVTEGVVRWDFGQPYRIARGADGYCVHVDRGTLRCGIHAHRPATCRGYDCRKDARIWRDFERRVVNPALREADWPRNASTDPFPEPAVRDAATFAAPPAAAGLTPPSPIARLAHRLLSPLVDRPIIWRGRHWLLATFGLWVGLGLGAAVLVALLLLTERFQQALPQPALLLGVVVSGYLGSRGAGLLVRWLALRLAQPLVAQRGHLLFGGLALGGIYIFAILPMGTRIPPLLLIDCAAPAAALGYALGKLGCLANGCCIGMHRGGAWGVVYRHPDSKAVCYYDLAGVPLLPVQLLEVGLGLLLCAVLLLTPDSFYGSGKATGLLLVGLALGRALLMPLRHRSAGERAYPLVAASGTVLFVAVGATLLAGIVVPAAVAMPGAAGDPATAWLGALLAACAGFVAFALQPAAGQEAT